MKALLDPGNALAQGLAAVRTEFQVPAGFPPHVLQAAEAAAKRVPSSHIDRTGLPFVTLDPAPSTDLDQAFCIESSGADLILRYAIADVDWFVDEGGAIDVEAWHRGESLYLPDGKAGLYPPILSEGAASLLPGGPRPAVVFIVRVDPNGAVRLDGVERAIVRSRAKLAYENVQAADLPAQFGELARRIQAAETARGAARVDPPEQEVAALPEGGYRLVFRPRLASEDDNAALSLATNMAVADALYAHQTGLFRVMDEPSASAIARLRLTAAAFGIAWPAGMPLEKFERTLHQRDPRQAALMLAIRRAGPGASYAPYRPSVVPWHAAMAATYAHATAPLRRLADRYVVRTALEIANGRPVPATARDAFDKLPAVMAKADSIAGRIDRMVVDLAEAVLLSGQEGTVFPAVVTDSDKHGSKVQLRDHPVVARITETAEPGTRLDIRLTGVDTARRTVTFERA
ncbi:RNB domain-containing ribonuclease [Sphingomonas sp. dw_22]|uniref:RNB domain-containing ribonuclease n=1 Tax=Sphingomonas sp. dw_22 TaxID=2721175 RepID=UPI001BD4F969|nr:RNB domain-containing ribonuclease [Sphingomonas sp. dw_22]